MEREEYRIVIKFLVRLNKSNTEIDSMLREAYGDAAPSLRVTKTWAARFRAGRESVHDDVHTGRPRIPEVEEQVISVLSEDPLASLRCIAASVDVSVQTVSNILQRSGYRYFLTKFVPHSLSECQKEERMKTAHELLGHFEGASHRKLIDTLTGDQSWVHYEREKPGSCVLSRENSLVEVSRICSRKIMLTVIFSAWGFHVIDFLPHGSSFNSDYMTDVVLEKAGSIL